MLKNFSLQVRNIRNQTIAELSSHSIRIKMAQSSQVRNTRIDMPPLSQNHGKPVFFPTLPKLSRVEKLLRHAIKRALGRVREG